MGILAQGTGGFSPGAEGVEARSCWLLLSPISMSRARVRLRVWHILLLWVSGTLSQVFSLLFVCFFSFLGSQGLCSPQLLLAHLLPVCYLSLLCQEQQQELWISSSLLLPPETAKQCCKKAPVAQTPPFFALFNLTRFLLFLQVPAT